MVGALSNFAPSFTQKPKLRQEDDGNKLIFECQLSASPQPEIEWFRGDDPVSEGKRTKIIIQPLTGNLYDVKLTLDDVEEDDQGLYKVKAKNKYGEVSASINLNFSPADQTDRKQIEGMAPTFAQKPVIIQEGAGKHIKFQCRINADPKPAVIWYRDGNKVQESSRCKVTIEKEGSAYVLTLSLTDVTVEDAGKYKVTAKNELGESNANIRLNFDSSFMLISEGQTELPASGELRPAFTERPTIRQSDDCLSIIFMCRCVGKPKPEITWEFKGKKLRDGGRFKMKMDAEGKLYHMVSLEISKVSNADEGDYKVIAKNSVGEGQATISLSFEGKTATDKPKLKIPDGKAPRFPKKPEIRQEGDKLVMECLLEANPEPEVTWYKDTTLIQDQGRVSMYKKIMGKDQYMVSVQIANPTEEDGGAWRCNAFNPFGDSNANINLNFEKGKGVPEGYAPIFIDKPTIIPNERGTMITMKVRVKAKPEPTVEWFKDEAQLVEAKRLVIKSHKVTSEMFEFSCIVKKPQASDGGVYKCHIANVFGELNANLNLNIEVAPTIKTQPRVVSIINRKCIIECMVMSSSQPACSWFHMENKVKLDSRHCITVNEDGEGSYKCQMEIMKITKEDAGIYKMIAKNDKGETTSEVIELSADQIEEKPLEKPAEKAAPAPVPEKKDSIKPTPPGSKRGSLAPEETLGKRRPSSDARRGSAKDEEDPRLKAASTPLQAIGPPGPPKILDYEPKYSSVEDKAGFIDFRIEGNGVPEIKFFKGSALLESKNPRYKIHTDGTTNKVTLIILKCKSADEGIYTIVATNEHGEDKKEVELYVSDASGMDFRAMLAKKKQNKFKKEQDDPNWGKLKETEKAAAVPALKKVEKKQESWVKPLPDKEVTEKKDKKVLFEAEFSRKNTKAKWYFKRDEIFNGPKYNITEKGVEHTLTILKPTLEDMGKYRVQCMGIDSEALLTVQEAVPDFKFTKPLKKKTAGLTNKDITMEAVVNSHKAVVDWYKADVKIEEGDKYVFFTDMQGRVKLTIKESTKKDKGKYQAKIRKLEDKKEACTETTVAVSDTKFKFTKQLMSKTVKEDTKVVLECQVDEEEAEVDWFYKDNKVHESEVVEIVSEGRQRKLVFKSIKMEDEGAWTCKTNADETICELIVQYKNSWIKKLEDQTVKEKTESIFGVEMEDHKVTTVEWFMKEVKIEASERFEFKYVGKGVHHLIIKETLMEDAGEIKCVCERLNTKCTFTVQEKVKKEKPEKAAEPEPEAAPDKRKKQSRPWIINKEVFENIVIKREKDFSLNVDFGGNPKPEVKWIKQPFKSTEWSEVVLEERITIDNSKDLNTIFSVKMGIRSDTAKYKLHLKNAAGECEEVCDVVVLAKPNRPEGPLEAIEVGQDKVKLAWKKPFDDGGYPIENYELEFMDLETGEWKPAGKTGPDDLEFEVKGLIPEKQYKFRVKAINKEGPSDPIESDVITTGAKPKKKPKIDRKNLVQTTIKAGKAVKIDCDIEGLPVPKVKWYYQQKVLSEENITIIDVNNNTKLNLLDGKRKQTGMYKVYAENEHGTDEYEFEIVILSGPSKPKGPLRVFDVSKKKCKLKWEKPEDDGGDPIKEYVVEKMDASTGEWVPVGKTKDMIMDVPDLDEGKEYHFRVKAVNNEGESEPLQTEHATLMKDPFGLPSAPGKPEIIDYDNKSVHLKFLVSEDDGGAPIMKYVVMKKEKKDADWEKAGEVTCDVITPPTPGDFMEYNCTGLKFRGVYQFKAYAINKAGQGPDSPPTDWHTVRHKMLKPKIDRTHCKQTTTKAGKTLKFDIDIEGEPAPKVKWTIAGKDLDEPNIELVNVDYNTKMTMTEAKRKQTAMYKIFAENEHGTDEVEFEIVVLAGPGKPKGPLKVSDVTKKSCKLKWEPPEDDGGKPIEEYIVEKMEMDTGRWVPVGRTPKPSMDVPGLQEGKEYMFRVKAVNSEGESEPLEADAAIKAKDPYGPPGKPIPAPEICDWDIDRMDLTWVAPKDNGGAPITKYIIEKKEKVGASWEEIFTSEGPKTECRVPNLTEGKTYSFRVIAVNKAGPGEPSDPSKQMVAKARYVKPLINREKLKRIQVRKGQKIHLDVDVLGEPVPEIWWELKGKKVSDDKHWKINNEENNMTKITINDSVRPHTGMYKIRAKNNLGEDEADLEIVVLGPPGPPEGPLEITDIHKEGCKLKWKPPLDDGGLPLDNYIIEKMDVTSGKWVPCGRTPGDTTELEVTGLEPLKKYEFRVRAKNDEGESEPLNGDKAIVAKDPFEPPGPPGLPEITDFDETSVQLKWDKPLRDGGAPITGYIIEMRPKGSPDWKECGKVDGNNPKGPVEGLTEGEKYEFRVRAVNKAGPGEPSDSTLPHEARAKFKKPRIDRTNVKDVIIKVGQQYLFDIDVIGEPKPTNEWTLNDKECITEGQLRVDSSGNNTKFLIMKGQRKMTGKYTLKAKNKHGEDSVQIDLTVLGPPSKPMGPLEVDEIKANGCHLKWKKPEDDGGVPIDHYEIEKLDPITGQWMPCGTSKTPEADVTGLQEGKKYKFRVKAVNDEGESEPLETEAYITAKNPFDPPSKPGRPTPLNWDKDFVELEWKKPESDGGAEITKYIIEKRDMDGRGWSKCGECDAKLKTKVTDVEEGHEYQFRVIAVNKAGPSEPSDPSEPVVCKPRFLAPRIDRKMLGKKTIRSGTNMKLEIDVAGEPPANKKWTYKGAPITNDRWSVEDEDYQTIILLKKAKRSDSGLYKIVAKNDTGTDEYELDLTVVGKPGKCMGPIKVTDVTAESAKLKWLPPDDDGGAPIDHYVMERCDTETGRWVPVGKTKIPEGEVPGLTEGKHYDFRVRAVNEEGESDPLETDASTLAKNPYDVPSKPGKPEVGDYDKDWCDLKWTVPESDGGAEITHYIIEKKDDYSPKWLKHCETKSPKCETKLEDLQEGNTYQFRVKAVNKAGQSKPSDPSENWTAKAKFLPPVIDRTNLDDIKVSAGQMIRIDCRVTGEPEPKKIWFINKARQDSKTEGLKIDEEPHRIKMVIASCTRKHNGIFTIKADNSAGHDEYTMNVTVLDKPGPPEGPLRATDVHKTGCNLAWKPPLDDGGAPIEQYIVEKMDIDSGRWVPVGRSKTPNIEVENLEPNHEYKFRVSAVNSEGESEPLEGLDTVIAKNPFDPPSPPGRPDPQDWDTTWVDLKWTKPITDNGSPITGYIVEKRDEYTGKWVKAADIRGINPEGRVENLEEGETYEFRVKAVNEAGPSEPSEPSVPVTCKPRKLPPKIERKNVRDLEIVEGEPIFLDIKIIGEPAPDVEWYLGKKTVNETGSVRIENIPYNTKYFNDESLRKHSGLYTIKATNKHGKDEAEMEINIISKPGKPEGPIDVTDVHKEGCKLAWKPPKDDGGLPLDGYLVEKLDPDSGLWLPVGRTKEPEIEVNDLTPGNEYEFRVKAINPQGESEPLCTLAPIIAKDPFGPPGKPGAPKATDWDSTWIEMEWTEPFDDGGAAISHYIIEKKDKYTDMWEKAGETHSPECKGRAKNLSEGMEYRFRVTAVNKAGPGEPSDPSKPCTAKPRFQPPKIDRKNVRDITISAGSMLKYDIDVSGEPAPTTTWTYEGEKLESDKHVNITDTDYKTKLIIRDAFRMDTGEYQLVAVNSSGRDQVTVNVTVTDVPGPPEDPMKASDITGTGCSLKWRRPKDDGGCPIENYQIEKLDPYTGTWIPCGRTKGPECNIDLNNLTPGEEYQFRVCAVNAEGESEPLEMEEKVLAKDPYDVPGPPENLKVDDVDVNAVDLKWEKPKTDGGSPITKYIIEKKDKFGDWDKAGEVPGHKLTYTVPDLIEGETYQFRVRAENAAGPGEPSKATPPVTLKPRSAPPRIDRTNLNPIRINAGQSFVFDVKVTGEPIPDKKWSLKKKEIKPHGAHMMSFQDYSTKLRVGDATRAESGTYTIFAENCNGTDSVDVEVIVLDVPGAPMGPLKVSEIYSEGCKLDWKPPADDGGCPIDHYIVEVMDEATGRWLPSGETIGPETTFEVEGLTPDHRYKFRVKAVNRMGISEPLITAAAIVARCPFDPPGPPKNVTIDDFDVDFVDLKWKEPETDGGSPITGYIIEKKDKYNPLWTPCHTVDGNICEAHIPDLIEGNIYEFRVMAKNKAGPGEPSKPTPPHLARPKNLPPRIDRNAMMEVIIRAGENLTLPVPVAGEPAPTKKWKTSEGKELYANDRLTIRMEDYQTTIRILDTKRVDSGELTLEATNKNGDDVATVIIIVLDVPGPPEGPIKYSNVNRDGCTVSWKTPLDDGGSEIIHYVVEKMDMDNGRWVPCGEVKETSMKVENLIEGHDYKFRISAVNRQGQGPPTVALDTVTIKDPYTRPTKPGAPEVTDWDKDHVDLKWNEPKSDGGAPIDYYIIEKKTRYGPWEHAIKVPAKQGTKATVPDLTEDEEYTFRVIAVNKAGKSDPSDPSQPVTCKARFEKPEIDVRELGDLILKVNTRLNYTVPTRGAPRPKITWTVDGKVLPESERVDMQTYGKQTILDIPFSQRSDSGRYTLTLENELGKASCSGTVIVMDKPDIPQGPLNVFDIHREGCKVSFRTPLDDGGSPILHYLIEKMDVSRGTWNEVCECSGLLAEVTGLTPLKEYHFRVKAVNAIGESVPLMTDNSIIAKNQVDEPSQPGRPNVLDWDSDRVELEWAPPKSDGGSPITGYIIQKKERGSPYWSNACRTPGPECRFTVPNLTEGAEYEFRVIAVNKVGNSEPSEPSDSVICRPRNLAPKIIGPLYDVTIKAGQVLHIDVDYIGEPDPDVFWFTDDEEIVDVAVMRTTLTAINHHTVLHTVNTVRSDSGEYRIRVKNESGQDEATFRVNILDKPGPPQGPMVYEEVQANSVLISWRLPLDNGGSPLTGYVIEKRDCTHGGGWVPAVNWVDPKDLHCNVPRLLEGTTYEFRVAAENAQGRGEALVSDQPVTAKASADVPGRPGRPECIDSDKDFIQIKWAAPRSTGGSPITGYEVERCGIHSGRWKKISRENVKGTDYTDDNVNAGEQYQYRVIANNKIGSSMPSEPSLPITAKPMREAPKLYLDGLVGKKLKVRAGDPINVKIALSGSPQPECTWTKLGKKVEPSKRTSMEVTNDYCRLLMEKSRREDSGMFTITAENDHGKDSANVEVLVVDRPSPPIGPLQYTEVTGTTVSCTWKVPQDDGGSDITGYVLEKTDATYELWKVIPGHCPRCNFTVKGLEEGKKYKFRVRAENMYGASDPLEGKPVDAKNAFDPPDAPDRPDVTAYGPNSADLEWKPPAWDGGRPITGYIIEKRERGGDWVKVNNYPTPNTNYKVPGLIEGARYEFRVSALNEAGPSKPSKPSNSIVAQVQKNLPGPPEVPRPDRIGKTNVTLSWRPPTNDGGSKIKGYFLEIRQKDAEEWSPVNDVAHPDTNYMVLGLTELEEYYFRVSAVNDVGRGPPSRASGLIKIEEQANKPRIDLGAVRDITIRAGEDFSIHLPYTAFPKPTSIWYRDDEELALKSDSRFTEQLTDDFCALILRGGKRTDAGPYKLRLTNSSGFDSCTVNVRVLDRPGPPENLRAEEFNGDALTLYWNPPRDNGGAEVTNYVLEKREGSSGSWSKISSYVTGTFLRIRNLTVGSVYDFRVMAENQYGQSDPCMNDTPIKARHPFDVPGAPGAPRGTESTEDSISITWAKPRHDGGSPITGYVIEKRNVGDTHWFKASHATVKDISYRVINLTEGNEYEFRAAAINAAGQGPWSDPSDNIKCMSFRAPKITSDLSIRDMTVIAGEEFTITVPYIASPHPKVQWWIGPNEALPDERIQFHTDTSSSSTVLINKKAKRPNDVGKYTIKLTNSEGADTGSCKVNVVDRPSAPQGPIDASDITPDTCSLAWHAPADDGGSPVTNYQVERMDVATGIWVKCTAFVRPTHYDVMGLEANHTYHFRIKAENQYGISDPLQTIDPITASFPFTVPDPPGRPNIVDSDISSVNLSWERPAVDGGSRIQGYKVEYRDITDTIWTEANDFLVKETTYTVHSLLIKHEYEFRVKAKNAAGYSKYSPPSKPVKMKGKYTVPSPPGTPVVTKIGKNYVDLKWSLPESDGGSRITGYLIEKRELGSIWMKCSEYNIQDLTYTVINLTEGSDVEFRVYAINAAGKSDPSAPSAPVKVREALEGEKPYFIRNLYDTAVPLHRAITLECEADGKPLPKPRWLKNGREITLGGRISTSTEKGVFKLTISDMWEMDEGDYACVAANDAGQATTVGRVKIGNPPRITQIPDALYLPEADNTKIKIYFSGDLPLTVTLKVDGAPIEESQRVKITVFDEFIIVFIREVMKTDAGHYTLEVKNDCGAVTGDFNVYITGVPGAPIGPLEITGIDRHMCTLTWHPPAYDGGMPITHYVVERKDITYANWVTVASFCKELTYIAMGLTENQEYLFRVSAVNENGMGQALEGPNPIKAKAPYDPPAPPGIPDVTAVGGDFVHLEWEKPVHDGGSRIKGYWIEKREVGSNIWTIINQYICAPTQCNVSNLIEERQYEFRVFAENEAGRSEASLCSNEVKIRDPDAALAPEIVTPLKKVMALEHKSTTMTTKISGRGLRISWFKGMRELCGGSKYIMTRNDEEYSLTVNDVYGEDEDDYMCRAQNAGGIKTTKAELSIKLAPKINVPPRFRQTAFFEKGENSVVKIPFVGNPRPKITWTKEGEAIEEGGHFGVETQARHAILTLIDPTQIDTGAYRITAENELGSDSKTINIQISDRPDPPRMPKVESVLKTEAVLTWQVPAWDGGANINNYLLEKRELPMESWIKCGSTRLTTAQIKGLSPGHQYEFRVYAENVYGRSNPSVPSSPCSTPAPDIKKARRKVYEVDETGKKIRGTKETVDNYDKFVFDIYSKYVAQAVDIKYESVYEYYDIHEEIGVGAFGVVHRCSEQKTGNIFAAKFIPVSSAIEKELIRKEIDIMNQLHHNKLINLHDAFEDDDEMVLIFEFLSGGELFERITAEGYVMSEAVVINYMRQICEGLKHMHEQSIIHLDIKPENIMCKTKVSADVKLIDFGLATKIDPNEVVKVSTGTAEFAAPEIVERQPVGFFTDMWSVGVLAYVLLSGLSPFAGDNDIETLKNVKACDWDFDEEVFANVSNEAKDFIKLLLMKSTDKRMTSHECLMHAWLRGDYSPRLEPIDIMRYIPIRDKIRAKYKEWEKFLVPIGRMSEYSSLRKLNKIKYNIHDTTLDRRQFVPRFVIRPQNQFSYEGQSVKFTCRVVALAAPTITWYHSNLELRQSVKFMKRYAGEDYTFVINRVKLDDRGEYIIRAENTYGASEEPVFLNVQPVPSEAPVYKPTEQVVRRRQPMNYQMWQEDREAAPSFTFLLRPRVIQCYQTCKLLCCLAGKPTPQVSWFKGSKELTKVDYNMSHSDGVVTMEIMNSKPSDSGKYRCVAKNDLGIDETSCVVICEGSDATDCNTALLKNLSHDVLH